MNQKPCKYIKEGAIPEKKFDMNKAPIKQKKYVLPFLWAFANIRKWLLLGKINKIGMKGIKPPYILICNHNAFYDFYIMSAAIAPNTGIFPAAVDDYIGRERQLRKLGAIPKRKFTADVSILRNCRWALKEKLIFGIYAEAKYSLIGETEVIPDAIGQLIKHQKVPVVVLTCRGHHIYDPFWGNHRHRWVHPVQADMVCAYTPEQLKTASIDEINAKLRELLYNDDFR